MAIIYTGTRPLKKPKKKPGWQEERERYLEWLSQWQSNEEKYAFKPLTPKAPVVDPSRSTRHIPSVKTAPIVKEVIHDPRVRYKDDPELVERELKARERKFTAAPIYNKGGDMLITDEMMKDIMSGASRRRN